MCNYCHGLLVSVQKVYNDAELLNITFLLVLYCISQVLHL